MPVFLLTPKSEVMDNQFYSVLIWSNDENGAREKAYSIAQADDENNQLPFSPKEMNVFKSNKKSNCKLLKEGSDYQTIMSNVNEKQIRYKDKIYILERDCSETINSCDE
ncbi:hypothetical protein DIZ73_17300 [Legionella pneumophila]|nr:hypothetical protein DIZ73_17300 [Legionella pneumophila]